jgi:hypothetical protein
MEARLAGMSEKCIADLALRPPAEIEIKMSASFLTCDPVEINRRVKKSAVYPRRFHNFTP